MTPLMVSRESVSVHCGERILTMSEVTDEFASRRNGPESAAKNHMINVQPLKRSEMQVSDAIYLLAT